MPPMILPELVIAAPPPTAPPVAVRALFLPPSETMIWDVRAGGMTIGRAELDVGDTDVHSTFKTSALASMFATIRHDLVTTLDRAGARAQTATETVNASGETTHSEVAFDGNGYTLDGGPRLAIPEGHVAHTMHSALGWLRAWADVNAAPTVLYVVEDRRLYRIELARPNAEDLRGAATIRVEGIIHIDDEAVAVTAWFSADDNRRPVRLAIVAGKYHLTAELVT